MSLNARVMLELGREGLAKTGPRGPFGVVGIIRVGGITRDSGLFVIRFCFKGVFIGQHRVQGRSRRSREER